MKKRDEWPETYYFDKRGSGANPSDLLKLKKNDLQGKKKQKKKMPFMTMRPAYKDNSGQPFKLKKSLLALDKKITMNDVGSPLKFIHTVSNKT